MHTIHHSPATRRYGSSLASEPHTDIAHGEVEAMTHHKAMKTGYQIAVGLLAGYSVATLVVLGLYSHQEVRDNIYNEPMSFKNKNGVTTTYNNYTYVGAAVVASLACNVAAMLLLLRLLIYLDGCQPPTQANWVKEILCGRLAANKYVDIMVALISVLQFATCVTTYISFGVTCTKSDAGCFHWVTPLGGLVLFNAAVQFAVVAMVVMGLLLSVVLCLCDPSVCNRPVHGGEPTARPLSVPHPAAGQAAQPLPTHHRVPVLGMSEPTPIPIELDRVSTSASTTTMTLSEQLIVV